MIWWLTARERSLTAVDTLGDDLILLSLDPASGRIMTTQKIAYGLMGSELVRLVAAGRVDIGDGRLVVVNAAATGDAQLDAALASIAQAGRRPRARHWVSHPRSGIATAYLERLAAAGTVRQEGTFRVRWRATDPRSLAGARSRLEAIASPGARLGLRQTALGGLAHAIGLDAALYPGWGNRTIRRRFKEIADGAWTEAAEPHQAEGADAAVGAGADAAHHAAVHRATHAAARGAGDAVHAATHAAVHAATDAAVRAATDAAVHAAVSAAVSASVSAAHDAGGSAAHTGHGGH
jgi:Golgi phosphoprotein 3 GPP34